MYCRIKQFYCTVLPILIVCVATVFVANAQSDTSSTKNFSDVVQTRGYVKSLQSASFSGLDDLVTQNLLHWRYNTRTYLSKPLTLAIEMRNRLFYGESIKLQPGFGDALDVDHGYWDLSTSIVNKDAVVFHVILDRVWLNWASDKWDVRIGRQRINWGVNLVWNPNDLFNTYNFADFDYEERPGSDGVRITRYLKGLSSIEVGGKFSNNPDSTVVAGLYKFNKWGYDIQVLSGVYYEDLTLGLGWAGNLKTAGLKGEATYFHPRYHGIDTSGVLVTSITVDYSFKEPIYVTGSMLYNSAGTPDDVNFFQVYTLSSDLTAKNLMPTKFSYFLQLSSTLNPLLSANLAGIYGAGMDLLFLMPSLTYAINDAWDIMLLGQIVGADYSGNFTGLGNAVFIRTKWSY